MPTYDYKAKVDPEKGYTGCDYCKHGKDPFEVIQRMSDPVLTNCPGCGSPLEKLITTPGAFVLKGEGWYRDGYTKKAKAPDKSSD